MRHSWSVNVLTNESLEVGRYVHSVGRANNNSLSLDIKLMSSPNLYGDQNLLTCSD